MVNRWPDAVSIPAMDMKQIVPSLGCSLAICMLVPSLALAWNPYDTDSARQRGYGYSDDYGSPGYYGTPQPPASWERGQGPLTREEPRRAADQDQWDGSSWYASDPRRNSEAWRRDPGGPSPVRDRRDTWDQQRDAGYDRGVGGYSGAPAESDYADSWRFSDSQGGQQPGTGWERPMHEDIWQPPEPSGWSAPAQPRYRFREDPELDALSGRSAGVQGYRYRPLTQRERERQAPQPGFPEYRARDLQPRGPWRSYEDEGTAFGYHPDAAPYGRYYDPPQ